MKISKEKITISKETFASVLEEGLNNEDVLGTFVEWLESELVFYVNVDRVYLWLVDIVKCNTNEDGTWNYSFVNEDKEEFEFDTESICYWDYDEYKRVESLKVKIDNTKNVKKLRILCKEILRCQYKQRKEDAFKDRLLKIKKYELEKKGTV